MKNNPVVTDGNRIIADGDLERAGWECNEPGWWTHSERGGICREGGKWWFYPRAGGKHGPYLTATAAARSKPVSV